MAAILAFMGIALTLAAAGAAPIWYPVALGALSVAVYAGQVPWERLYDRGSDWIAAHRYLGLGGAGMTALSGFALFDYTRPGTLGCALAGLAVLVFAGLVAVDGRRFGHPVWDYAAAFAASLATYFAARYFALANPEWYLAGPGLTLVAIGLRMPFDARLKPDHRLPQLAVAAGALLILGVTASQAVVDPGWTNTVLLVIEGAASLVAGIGFRSRVLVVAGGAAIGVAALRSLFVLVQQGLLFVAFGAVALTLLGPRRGAGAAPRPLPGGALLLRRAVAGVELGGLLGGRRSRNRPDADQVDHGARQHEPGTDQHRDVEGVARGQRGGGRDGMVGSRRGPVERADGRPQRR